MNSQPMVSCIVIFLNEERFIQEAIESVCAQTYDHWELLLVDDGSTDQSTKIARSYVERYPQQIHYFEHEGHSNRGMSASRNLGVHNAKGKYLAFLDGDDVWLREKLEEQVAILEEHPQADMVHGPLQMWFSWTGHPKDRERDYLLGERKNSKHPYADTLVDPPSLLELFLRHEEYIPSGYLAKSDIMKKVGTFEESFFDAYSDAVALVKVCLASRVFVSSKCWYKYRKHPESNTYLSFIHGKDDEEQRIYLNWVEAYFKKKYVANRRLQTIVRKMLYRHRHPKWHRLKKSASLHAWRIASSLVCRLRAKWRGRENVHL